jgi:hypothetical protein
MISYQEDQRSKKIVDVYGTIIYYKNNKFHREDGPAVEFSNGSRYWYINGIRHRDDGPAIELSDGYKEYWLNGEYYKNINSDEQWKSFVVKILLLG